MPSRRTNANSTTRRSKTRRPRTRQETAGDLATPTRPLELALDYANASPTERNWRSVVLGKLRSLVLPRGATPPDAPPFGVHSLEECQRTLHEFREFLAAIIAERDLRSIRAMDLARELHARSGLVLTGLGWDTGSKRLVPRWDTRDSSFEEMLYAQLALALQHVPHGHLHRCERCGRFFFQPTKRLFRYCSARCRNQALVQRYRERHPERHRESHRKLMRQRRAEGKD